jgi:TetR/AcrR family transcriptional regulator
VTEARDDSEPRLQHWGTATSLLDDEEARRRLVSATLRCIVRRGTGRISVGDVADEAGVSRTTVYRYYRTREDLLTGVMLSRLDKAMDLIVRSLEEPDNAARSIPDLILVAIGLAHGKVEKALYSPDSRQFVTAVQMTSELVSDGVYRHISPLLQRWQADGQLASDLDLRTTARWVQWVSVMLMSPPWLEMPVADKRAFLDRYVVAAFLAR